MAASLLDGAAIRAAAERISPYVRRTPVLEVDGADFGLPGVRLAFKLEFLQHAGSFKTRGAFNNLLSREIPAAGVVAASGGNHGAAVAYAAMKRGVPATIFIPSVASPAKMEQIRGYGAHLEIAGERYNDALLASQRWTEERSQADCGEEQRKRSGKPACRTPDVCQEGRQKETGGDRA